MMDWWGCTFWTLAKGISDIVDLVLKDFRGNLKCSSIRGMVK
jgi:hypothetical protein